MRWSHLGAFAHILVALAGAANTPEQPTIDGSHLKAHRTACPLPKGFFLLPRTQKAA